MSEQLQLRRGTAALVAGFIAQQGECVVDVTNNRICVGDGTTAGAWPAAKLAEVVTNTRTAVSDAAYTVLTTDRAVAYTALTAARIVSLPAASAYPTGTGLTVVDESGACSATNTLTINRAGSDTINGAASAVISAPYGLIELESNGSNKWTIVDQTGGPLILPAGNASTPPLEFTIGTSTTTAQQGAVEFDGNVFYATIAPSKRGIVVAEQIEILSASYTLVSQTAAQQLLNASSGGAITLAARAYEFECLFSLSSMSSSSGSFGFALGGTATFTQEWWATAAQAATPATPVTPQTTFNTAAANAALTAAGTATNGYALIKGILRVTVSGTLIPEVSLGVAAAAVVGANSYFKIAPLGAAAMTIAGQWS